MDRVYFIKRRDRSNFFSEIKKSPKITGWKKLAEMLKTSRSMVDKYRRGKLYIPEEKFNLFLELVKEDKRDFFNSLIKKKKSNWGQVVGGKKAYKLNKKEFNEGRKKAWEARKNQARYNFDINMDLSEELCEFIGVFIGDGFTNRYKNHYQTQITGDSRLDSDYYYNRLKSICEKLFNFSPKIIEKKSVIRLNIYSKKVFEMLTKRFHFPRGEKSHSVRIPLEIYKAKGRLLNLTLRGMFNTDGGVGFDKRGVYKKPYIRINYTSASKKLIEQVHNTLSDYSINHSIHKKKEEAFMIQINGIENVRKFLSRIGFSNKRHLDKINIS